MDVVITAGAWLTSLYSLHLVLKEKRIQPEVYVMNGENIVIGFNVDGPLIYLNLAFSVKCNDLIVDGFKIMLEHEDGEMKTFKWKGMNQTFSATTTLDGGFMATGKESSVLALKLNQTDIVERFIRCQEPSFVFKKEKLVVELNKKIRLEREKSVFDLAGIIESKEILELKDCITQSFNWKKGKYIITVELKSPEKFKILNDRFYFSLSRAEVETLTSNKEEIIKSIVFDLTKDSGDSGSNPKPEWRLARVQLSSNEKHDIT